MLQIIISGKTTEELLASANSAVALLGGTSAKASTVLSASDQARLRGEAVVVPPSGKSDTDASSTSKDKTTAEKKTAEKAAKKAAEEAAKKAAEQAEKDALGETEDEATDGDAEEALTQDDVKKLLIAVREAYPKKTTIISEIVKEHGKAAKLSEVEDSNLGAVAAHCRKLLKDAA